MGLLQVHEFMTFDSVIDEPSWVGDHPYDPRIVESTNAIVGRCSDLLFGRRTYEFFEPGWSNRTAEDDPIAPFFNDNTKHVVSNTQPNLSWRNSSLLGPYDADVIRRLKEQAAGDVFTSASGTLVRAMLADGLVDELHLFVYPVTLGAGPRLFPDGAAPQSLELIKSEAYDGGVLYFNFRPRPKV